MSRALSICSSSVAVTSLCTEAYLSGGPCCVLHSPTHLRVGDGPVLPPVKRLAFLFCGPLLSLPAATHAQEHACCDETGTPCCLPALTPHTQGRCESLRALKSDLSRSCCRQGAHRMSECIGELTNLATFVRSGCILAKSVTWGHAVEALGLQQADLRAAARLSVPASLLGGLALYTSHRSSACAPPMSMVWHGRLLVPG